MDCGNLPPCHHPETECRCFTYSDSDEPEKDQFCGYLLSDGKTIRPCAPNCCNGGMGCPGQCRAPGPKRPDFVLESDGTPRGVTTLLAPERILTFENILKLLVVLCIISTISLFVKA